MNTSDHSIVPTIFDEWFIEAYNMSRVRKVFFIVSCKTPSVSVFILAEKANDQAVLFKIIPEMGGAYESFFPKRKTNVRPYGSIKRGKDSLKRIWYLVNKKLHQKAPYRKIAYQLKKNAYERYIRSSRISFSLSEFNAFLVKEITLFRQGIDGSLRLYSYVQNREFPYFNFYVFDGVQFHVMELMYLVMVDRTEDRSGWVVECNPIHFHNWCEGTFIVLNSKGLQKSTKRAASS